MDDKTWHETYGGQTAPGWAWRRIFELENRLGGDPDSMANVLDQAERAGKVPALEAQVRALKDDLNSVRGRVDGQVDRIRDLEAERDALLLKAEADRAADHDLVMAVRAERDENQRELTQAKNNLLLVKTELSDPTAPHSERVSNALRILV